MTDDDARAWLDDHLRDLGVPYELFPCDPSLADTAAFCAAYGFLPEDSANTIVVVGKSDPPVYAACVVLSNTRLDVNRVVRQRLGTRKASFAPAEETRAITGMEIGGVTVFGLPSELPIWVDSRVVTRERIVLGGGSRSTKVIAPPAILLKLPGAEVGQDDIRPAIECALDEEPLAPHPVALPVDRTRPHDRSRNTSVLQQDAFELHLLRRVRVVAGLYCRLRLRYRDRELGEVVDALRLVERTSLEVGVDRRRGDCDQRTGVELEQLHGVRCFERDHVDDDVEPVRNGQRAYLISVEHDVVEGRRRRPLGLSCERDLPAVVRERVRDGQTDVAGATENEGAPRDRSLRRARRDRPR